MRTRTEWWSVIDVDVENRPAVLRGAEFWSRNKEVVKGQGRDDVRIGRRSIKRDRAQLAQSTVQ